MIVSLGRWSWKGHSSVTPGKLCLSTFIVPVSWKTELQAILRKDEALSQCDSYSHKMVLKRLCISDIGEISAHSLFRSQGDRAFNCSLRKQSFKPFCWEAEHWLDMIDLVRRQCWKGHLSVIWGNLCSAHSLFRSLVDRGPSVHMLVLEELIFDDFHFRKVWWS